jgi:hypothetical protein
MITMILFISIFSKSLFCLGYFLFSMLLIFNYRKFLLDPEAANSQLYILSYLVPYILIDLFIMLLFQYPLIRISDTNAKTIINNLGVYRVWLILPRNLPFGYTLQVIEFL